MGRIVNRAFQVALVLKNLPVNAGETQLRSLGWEDPLQNGLSATHSSMLALENPIGRGAWWAIVHIVAKT